jgi:predicted lysophospholipase L1 biosynthesis ABC-type transport system permease subunit
MKLGFSWRYATRSLLRSGRYSLFAIVCVAVGVLVIVALQLVSLMVNAALTGNVRAFNGGDLAVHSESAGITGAQLGYFAGLEQQGVITTYSPVADGDSTTTTSTGLQRVLFWSVDPAAFPLAGTLPLVTPTGGSLPALLQGGGAVMTDSLMRRLQVRVGDTLHLTTSAGRSGNVIITGEIASTPLISGRTELLISQQTYDGFSNVTGVPSGYTWVFVDVPGASAAVSDKVAGQIAHHFPQLSVSTVPETAAHIQAQIDAIHTFLRIIGLLALLIGGVGIINTMQVLLRRRLVEIAMLKTVGFRRQNLLLMFGIEALLLGILGGAIGALAGIGLCFVVQALVERAFFLTLPTIIDAGTLLGGTGIGVATAFIFGLLPILQTSATRPVAVLRDLGQETRGWSGRLSSLGLVILLIMLFALLAFGILGSLAVTLEVVLSTGVVLGLLTAGFSLVAWLLSHWRVPDHRHAGSLLALLPLLLVGVVLLRLSPGFGALVLVLVAAAALVAVLPKAGRAETQLALRNIGRARVRSATTLAALFVGVFAVGLGLVLGQNLKSFIYARGSAVNQDNAYILSSSREAPQVEAAISRLGDAENVVISLAAPARVLAINCRPLPPTASQTGNLTGINGFDLAHNNLPPATLSQGSQDATTGRLLVPADAGSLNAVFPLTYSQPPDDIRLGDRVDVSSLNGSVHRTLHVVGFYTGLGTFGDLSAILADQGVANTLGTEQLYTIFALRLPETSQNQNLQRIAQSVPGVITLGDQATLNQLDSVLNNVVQVVEGVASLAMFAGLVLIADTAALAMLERRRELGMLKAIGHTSRGVLAMILVENGVLGASSAAGALILVSLSATVLSRFIFHSPGQPGASIALTLLLALATSALCMLVAGAVTWPSTRIRPLEVLRYE